MAAELREGKIEVAELFSDFRCIGSRVFKLDRKFIHFGAYLAPNLRRIVPVEADLGGDFAYGHGLRHRRLLALSCRK